MKKKVNVVEIITDASSSVITMLGKRACMHEGKDGDILIE